MIDASWPPVTVLIVTFRRPNPVREVIQGLQHHLIYDGELKWHLADDGSPPDYVQAIKGDFPELDWSSTITARKGWGANVNAALGFIKTDLFFLCEDDYLPIVNLDLNSGVALLMAQEKLGLVRYKFFGGENLKFISQEAETQIGKMQYFLVDKEESGFFQYSNTPHLTHRRFHEGWGYYDEGLSLGGTEVSFAGRYYDSPGGPYVAVLSDREGNAFKPLAKSWQGSKFDKETVIEKEMKDE